jgi:cobalt-precorrin 5A hydrolase / precorrin-3B C17-methyltransferase
MFLDQEIEQIFQDKGWQPGIGDWDAVKRAISQSGTIEVFQDCGLTDWQAILGPKPNFLFDFPEIGEIRQPQARIWISYIQRRFAIATDFPKIQWHPPVLWLGIGCRVDVSATLLFEAIHITCRSYHLSEAAIAGIATIDNRSNHPGILELTLAKKWLLQSYSANQLNQIIVPQPSKLLAEMIDTASVAEAAALLAANQKHLLVTKTVYQGSITLAIALESKL